MNVKMNKINRFDLAKAVVEIRVLEKNMLSNSMMDKILKEKDAIVIDQELKKAGYFKQKDSEITKHNYDELLMTSLEDFIDEMNCQSSSYEFLDLIFLEYDIFNIKTILMEQKEELNYESNPVLIPKDRVLRYKELSKDTWFFTPGKYDALYHEAKQIYEAEGAKCLQQFLDRKYFSLLLEISEQSRIPLFINYSKSKVDFYNFMLVLRMDKIARRNSKLTDDKIVSSLRENLIEGGYQPLEDFIDFYGMSLIKKKDYIYRTRYDKYLEEGIKVYGYDYDLSILERCMDDYLITICKENKNIALGPEPIFGYLMGRKYEIINIRLILTALFLNVPQQIIKERLRETYV